MPREGIDPRRHPVRDESATDADESVTGDAVDRAAAANAEHRPVEIAHGVVTRPAGPMTATVHALLRHLRAQGLTCVPEPLGVEGDRERLVHLDGEDGGRGWWHQHTDEGLASAARLLRAVHDASLGWVPPDDAVWGAPSVPASGVPGDELVVCHGDPGPWNMVWRDADAVGLIDWDYAHRAPRLHDVAYALRWFVPLRADEHALDWHHFPEVPDRRRRVQTFLTAYGGLPAFDVAETVARRVEDTRDLMTALAAGGTEPQRTWVADGAVEREQAEIDWIRGHRHLLD